MSDHLSREQLAELRTVLEQERDRLLGRSELDTVEEELPDPKDLQDRASDEVRRRDELARSDRDRARLREVEAALARMAAGDYGWCEETGDPIPFARLRAEPTSRYTVEAQEMLESEAARERAVDPNASDDVY